MPLSRASVVTWFVYRPTADGCRRRRSDWPKEVRPCPENNDMTV